jgi:ABC-2 type transport system permease protein
MHNIWLVIKHDFGVTIRQRSFWIMTFLIPLIMLGSQIYFVVTENDIGGLGTDSTETNGDEQTTAATHVGLVDPGNLIVEMPPNLETDLFITFASEDAARAALAADEIIQYVLIPRDYLQTGTVTVFDKNFQIFQDVSQMGVAFGNNGWMLEYMINYNLIGDDQLLATLQNPTPGTLATTHQVQVATVDEAETAVAEQDLSMVVASVMPYIFYFLLLMGSSYLMRVVIVEKENRIVELLLLSVDPVGLMVGKIIAMSLVMFIQILIWVGGGILLLNNSAEFLKITLFDFPTGFLGWAIAFLILGYLLFAAIMAAAGALSNNIREAGQITWLLVIPLMPTLMFGSLFLEDPNGWLSMTLSFFPFSAPSAMVTRIAVANVPLWQRLLSLGGLAITTYIVVTLAARFFRPHHLLSTSGFNWKRLATGWRG